MGTSGQIILPYGTAAETPSSGKVTLYPKSDKLIYIKNDEGTEYVLSIHTLLNLSDTPIMYDDGKYLRSTASGTEWVAISGSNHYELNNLDYASAGHIGFASSSDLTTVSGLVDTNISDISDNTTLITTTSGTLQIDIDTKLENVIEDIAPELGGDLSCNGYNIENVGRICGSSLSSRVYNNTGSTLIKGTAVTICGLHEEVCTVCVSDNREIGKMPCCGVIESDFVDGDEGCGIRVGRINMDTSGMTGNEKDRLYVQSDGSLDTTIPTSGMVQRVGFLVVKASGNAGRICVCIRGPRSMYSTKDQHPIVRMGDDVGHKKVVFKDYNNNEVGAFDDSGNLTLSGTIDTVDLAAFKSDFDSHDHDDLYYTESEVDDLITTVSGKLDDHNEMNNLDYASSGHTGFVSSDLLSMASAVELTIVSGTVTCTKTLHRIDTEGDIVTDDLDTIIGGTDGDIIIVRAENGTRTVVLKDGTGNLKLGGRDLGLIDTNMAVMLFYSGVLNQWLLIGDGGGSATAAVSDDAFSSAWDGGTAVAPSRNAVYDEMVTKSNLSHLHDDRYYTESEVDTISGSLNSTISTLQSDFDSHDHDDLYYTKTEANNFHTTLSGNLSDEIDNDITTFSGTIDHDTINNTHNLTTDINHDQLTNYFVAEHREIDDGGFDATDLWSAQKIDNELDAITTLSGVLDDHNHFDNLDGGTLGEYFHLTESEHTVLTSGVECAIHKHDDRYYTESEIDTISGSLSNEVDSDISTHSSSGDHDERYYVEAEVDTISGTLQTNIDSKSDIGHDHTENDITDLDKYTQTEVNTISGSLSVEIDSDISTHTSNVDAHHAENHNIASHSDTTATGAELDELTGSGDTSLHKHDNRYYTELEVDTISGTLSSEIDSDINVHISSSDHDDRYYTETELDNGQLDNRYYVESEIDTISGSLQTDIDGKSDTGHLHDNRYYTETEVDDLITTISGKLDDHDELNKLDYASSGHTGFQPSGDYSTVSELTTLSGALKNDIDGKADTVHVHDDRYYTELEVDSLITTFSGTIDHNTINNTHNLTTDIDHNQTTNYQIGEHRIINDSSSESTDLWSAEKIETRIVTATGTLTQDHSELTNLDYASSGHTGFQSSGNYATDSELTTLSGNLQTNIDTKDNYSSWSFAVDGSTKDAITSGDVLDFVGGDNITIIRSAEDQITISGSAGGGGGGLSWEVINTDTNAINGSGYLINASSENITLTLPPTPSEGDIIGACDIYEQATASGITIARNGSNIEGAVEDLIIDVDGSGFTLVYADATRGWEIVSEIGGSGNSVSDIAYPTGWDGETGIAPSKNAVAAIFSRDDNLIGVAGTAGFGVGICPAQLLPNGMTPLAGYDQLTNENYGNYQYRDGSIMCWIPRFYYKITTLAVDIKGTDTYETETLANAAGYAMHRAFIDGGVDQQGFFYDKYLCSKNAWGTGQIASSIPNGLPISTNSAHNPIADLTACAGNYYYETITAAHARDGVDGVVNSSSSYHVATLFQHGAIAMLSLAHGQAATATTYCAWYDSGGNTNYPKGNNNYLVDIDDTGVTFTSDGYSSPASSKTGSGSPFAKTTHNGQACGITDLNGNMWEINLGLVRSGTTSTEVINDSLGTTKFYVLKESVSAKDLTSGWTTGAGTSGSTAWGDAAYLEGATTSYDLLDLPMIGQAIGWIKFGNGANQVLDAATSGAGWLRTSLGIYLDAGSSAAGTNLFGVDGMYEYWRSNLCVLSGGGWGTGTAAGVWAASLSDSRTDSNDGVGFRLACYL